MSCTPPIIFTKSHTFIGSNGGISLVIIVPEIYPCTNIQLRLRDSASNVIEDWYDYAAVTSLSTTLNFPIRVDACFLDIRLNKCCADPDPPPPDPDDPPCALISSSYENECSDDLAIVDPYIKPEDSSISTPYNEISIPKKLNLKITQTSCSDISALLCTVRCAPIPPPDDPGGSCACEFNPSVNIDSLPPIPFGRSPFGVPIDFDMLCNDSNAKSSPNFGAPEYHTIKAYCSASYGLNAIPFIDGVGYDTTSLNSSTLVKVYECNNSTELRQWLNNHFRFFGINPSKTNITITWTYTDLYWSPYNFCISNSFFTAENGVVYVVLIPC